MLVGNKHRHWLPVVAFIFPVVLYIAVMILCKITPFGNRTLLIWDADGQYASFLAMWRRTLLGGGDFFYSLRQGLGGNLLGLIAYYLASPLNLLLVLFPPEKMPLAYSMLILLKIGLSGLCFWTYLQYARPGKGTGLLFSTTYALTGYTTVYCWNVMWMDAVVFLPLVVLGLRKIAQGERPFVYLASLSMTLFCNYYIGFMV